MLYLQSMTFSSLAEFLAILKTFGRLHLYFRLYVSGLPMILLVIYLLCVTRSESYSSCGDIITKRKYKVISIIAIIYALCALEEVILGIIYIIQEETNAINIVSTSEYRFFQSSQVTWVVNYSVKPILFLLAVIPYKKFLDNVVGLGREQ